jgi:hypothetical protein
VLRSAQTANALRNSPPVRVLEISGAVLASFQKLEVA